MNTLPEIWNDIDWAGIAQKAAITLVILIITWIVARLVRWLFAKLTKRVPALQRSGEDVLFGGAIIAVGFFIANLLANMASGTVSTIVRYATLVLFVAMGVSYMGIADSIIELAFGALVVGGAAAAALAFGLGGREAAARRLERMESSESRWGTTRAPSDTTTSASIDPVTGPGRTF